MPIGPRVGYGRTAEMFAWGDGQVLKLFHPGWPREWAEHELEVARAVHASGMASPAVGELTEVDGRVGIVFERIVGPSMLQELSARPWRLLRLARLLAELHATMHGCTAEGLPSLHARLTTKIERADGLPPGLRERALAALDRLPASSAICHGDYHPDNVLLSASGPVVIDWTDAANGNPLADVSRSSLLMRVGAPPVGRASALILLGRRWLHDAYLQRYFELSPGTRQELAAWELPVAVARLSERIPEETAQVLAIAEAATARRRSI